MTDSPHRQNVLDSILIKPAGPDCNLACGYCFYREKARLFPASPVHRMSTEVLEAMIRQLMASPARHLSLGWQGGEPTLLGQAFFEQAVRYQIEFGDGKSVGNSLQTNGLLLNDKWCKFLLKYNFLVGLSIDGPAAVHDRYRTDRSGAGTWLQCVDSAKLLLDSGVMVNALTVVNDYSARFPEEIYTALKAVGLEYHQYIPCVNFTEPPTALPGAGCVPPEAYGEFLVTLFDLWFADIRDGIPTTTVRNFDALLRKYLGEPPTDCTLLESCGNYLVVEHNGDVFPCDFFVKTKHRLGNLLSTPLTHLFESREMRTFGRRKKMLPAPCTSCRWRHLCRGGCPKDRPFVEGTYRESYLCKAYQRLFEHADDRLSALANRLEADTVRERKARVAAAIKNGTLNVGRNDPCPCGSRKKFKKCCLLSIQHPDKPTPIQQ